MTVDNLTPSPIWYVTPGESGLAWYWENEINGHRVTIIERPAINYVTWMGSTDTAVSDIRSAPSLGIAKLAAEAWAWAWGHE